MSVVKNEVTGRYVIVESFSKDEIEEFRQDSLKEAAKVELAEKVEAFKDYIEENNIAAENIEQAKVDFEEDYDSGPDYKNSHSLYHSVGAGEMVMTMISKLMEDPVVINHPDYYNQAHKAHDCLFNLTQMMTLDWFDMPGVK